MYRLIISYLNPPNPRHLRSTLAFTITSKNTSHQFYSQIPKSAHPPNFIRTNPPNPRHPRSTLAFAITSKHTFPNFIRPSPNPPIPKSANPRNPHIHTSPKSLHPHIPHPPIRILTLFFLEPCPFFLGPMSSSMVVFLFFFKKK